ncbi:MAG: OadG family protein [Rikenellaceae bacterium]|jgi:oxaloacetate decarboxylase gamma subunit|nr:OadG family protein [Rikenellaceae bacterium]
MNSFSDALMLMAVGMGTVFIALLLIIFCSRGLIAVINRWFPEQEVAPVVKKAAEIPAKTLAAITAAINIATNGKARVEKVEKK